MTEIDRQECQGGQDKRGSHNTQVLKASIPITFTLDITMVQKSNLFLKALALPWSLFTWYYHIGIYVFGAILRLHLPA